MAENADIETLSEPQSPARRATTRRRAAPVGADPSSETNNNVEQSATHDEDSADVADVDGRQGTLSGFEMPEAAVVSPMPPTVVASEPLVAAAPKAARTQRMSARSASRDAASGDVVEAPAPLEAAAPVAEPAPAPLAAGNVLDDARAAALADTVAALGGAIADQRRTIADLSRRLRWMVGVAVAALLVTVAAGIAQTVMLSRLIADANAQRERIDEAMLQQQAALSLALARLPQATAEAPAAAVASPGAVRSETAPAPAHRAAHVVRHSHRAKSAGH